MNSLVSRNGQQKFWNAVLAAEDSDEDGYSNGLELGDENGDGVVERTTNLSNPGDASSVPDFPNTAPSFTSSPVTSAEVGISYAYQAGAVDPENDSLTFSRVSGLDLLSVSSSGLVSGIPPLDAESVSSILLRVTDNGNPEEFADQSYTLQVRVSFTGWQALYFDSDVEPSFTEAGSGPDNDPALAIIVLADTSLGFDSSTVVQAVVSDPVVDDGLQRLTFVDPEVASGSKTRFFRLQVLRDLSVVVLPFLMEKPCHCLAVSLRSILKKSSMFSLHESFPWIP